MLLAQKRSQNLLIKTQLIYLLTHDFTQKTHKYKLNDSICISN
jgi:hypothetical protein